MHGRPRKAPTPEGTVASAAKALKLRSLQSLFLSNHHSQIYTKDALEISAKLLEVNPESYTAWNYRKLAVEHNLSQAESDPDLVRSILDEELRVVESALRQNFKSYGAWHHRKWVIGKGHSSIDHELRLLDRFQKADSRNFHAWNYRRFVAALMNRSQEDELQYTEDMISTNFSNYSAWHNRSVLLSQLLEKRAQGFFPKDEVLNKEYELVHNAIFTDPDDQSGWFYHLWLLDQTVKLDTPLLVASWPAHGSDVILSGNRFLDGTLSPFTSFHSDMGTFPLVIYFNQAVKGVNSSTVTVEYEFKTTKDLIWIPLPINNSRMAQAWVTYLKFPDVTLNSSKAYPVKVGIGYSQGISSSTDFPYGDPSQLAFTVCLQSVDSEHAEGQSGEVIIWRDDKFHIYETHSQESNPVVSLDQLSIKDDRESFASEWQVRSVTDEIGNFQELLSMTNCKIGKLTLARLLMAHDVLKSCKDTSDLKRATHFDEVLKLYSDLIKLDPKHSRYYKDEHSIVLLRQVTSSRESFLKHCYRYSDLTSSNKGCFCLRLNNSSLSRMGSVEQLLWVQMLDLSHNELQSIEGLEAMQLLSFLSLSNNKFSSFTALGPLRQLKSLKVLDLSYNEIGGHSIDATRYLCPSPLSHSVGSEWNPDELVTDDVDMTNYWEAYFIFNVLNLTQLDIVGNAVADEKFQSFLIKVLPTLKWLNSVQLH